MIEFSPVCVIRHFFLIPLRWRIRQILLYNNKIYKLKKFTKLENLQTYLRIWWGNRRLAPASICSRRWKAPPRRCPPPWPRWFAPRTDGSVLWSNGSRHCVIRPLPGVKKMTKICFCCYLQSRSDNEFMGIGSGWVYENQCSHVKRVFNVTFKHIIYTKRTWRIFSVFEVG